MPTGTRAKVTNAMVSDNAAIAQTKIALDFGETADMVAETPDVAASAGISTEIAPIDHVHGAACGTAGDITPDAVAAEGSAVTFARSDHGHGFACAAPGTTTLADSAAEGTGSTSARSDHKHAYIITGLADGRLLWDSITQVSLNGLVGTSKLIEINGAYLSLVAAAKTLTTGTNVMAADGTNSGAAMVANTTYYIYASNASASWGPSAVLASATAPTGGYLAASGNGANWRHVGWCRTNASTQFTDRFSVCSLFNGEPHSFNAFQGTDAAQEIPATTWTDITGLQKYILLPPGWSVFIVAHVICKHNTVSTLIYFTTKINSVSGTITRDSAYVANYDISKGLSQAYENITSSPIWVLCEVEAYGGATIFTVYGTVCTLGINIIPRHN